MNDVYPLWVEAHGVMIVTPVNWYQTSSPLRLMIDRLVCANSGNPDPTVSAQSHEGMVYVVWSANGSAARHCSSPQSP